MAPDTAVLTGDVAELKRKFQETLEGAKALVTKAETEERELTDTEAKAIEAAVAEAAGLKVRFEAKERDMSLSAQLDRMAGTGFHDPRSMVMAKSLGERFTESDEWKGWIGQFPNGRVPESVKGFTTPPVSIPDLGQRAITGRKVLTSADLTGTQFLIPRDDQGLVTQFTFAPPRALDLVTRGSTDSDLVTYVRIGTQTNNAVVVPESTTTAPDATPTVAEGFKPESDFTFTPASAPVYTIAHWVGATKQALADMGQLRTLIDNFLLSGLRDKLDNYVINGTGTGEPGGIYTVVNAAGNVTAFATSAIVTIRKAITALAGRGITPNAVLMNPADTEALDLAQNGLGIFYFGNGPTGAPSPAPIWGLQRVEDPKVPTGFAIVGDFSYAVLWDRQEASVSASDSHADFFTRNLVAILGEMRAAFAVTYPNAFQIADVVA